MRKKKQYEYNITLYEVIHPVYHTRITPNVEDVEYVLFKKANQYRAIHISNDSLCLTRYGRMFLGRFTDYVRDNPKNKLDEFVNCIFIKKIDDLGKLSDQDVKLAQNNGYLFQEQRNIFFYLERVGEMFILDNETLDLFRDDAGFEYQFKSKKFGKEDSIESKPRFILIQKVEKDK